jgi:hypothetical protein
MDAIEDDGGVKADTVIWSKGVKRDVKAQYKSALEFKDAYAIPIDGDVKARGIEFFASRRVPPASPARWIPARSRSSSGSRRSTSEGTSEDDLMESEDYTFSVGRIDLVGNLITNRRKGFAYWRPSQESLTVQLANGSTTRKIISVTLQTGEALYYGQNTGWYCVDVNGNQKSNAPATSGASSTADSKAVSVSLNTSIADSKALSVSTIASTNLSTFTTASGVTSSTESLRTSAGNSTTLSKTKSSFSF